MFDKTKGESKVNKEQRLRKFEEYLRDKDFIYEEDSLDDGTPFVRMRQTIENGEPLLIIIGFSDGYTEVDIFNIATIESPLKRDELLKLVNDLNLKYRYPRFMVNDEGRVSAEMSISHKDQSLFDVAAPMHMAMFAVKAIIDEYSKFMKLRWL